MKTCNYCGWTAPDTKRICTLCGRELANKNFMDFSLTGEQSQNGDSSLRDAIKHVTNATVRLSGIYLVKKDGKPVEEVIEATGFFVEENGKGYLVTVAHFADPVVRNRGSMLAKFPKTVLDTEGDSFLIHPLICDHVNDIALVGIDIPVPDKVKYLKLEPRSSVEQGDSVITIGSPAHIGFIHNSGSVALTSLNDNNIAMNKILCDLSTTNGNSGGSVVRVKDHAVIGMVKGAYEGAPNHTVCVAADAIKQLINNFERRN